MNGLEKQQQLITNMIYYVKQQGGKILAEETECLLPYFVFTLKGATYTLTTGKKLTFSNADMSKNNFSMIKQFETSSFNEIRTFFDNHFSLKENNIDKTFLKELIDNALWQLIKVKRIDYSNYYILQNFSYLITERHELSYLLILVNDILEVDLFLRALKKAEETLITEASNLNIDFVDYRGIYLFEEAYKKEKEEAI